MTYIVNGSEFSTKKDTTAAVFEAAERGEEVTLSKAKAEDAPAEAPAEGTTGPTVII